MTTKSISQITTAALASTLLVACSSTMGPETAPPPAANTAWDINLELQHVWVSGDCENNPTNPGEFAYEIRLETSAIAAVRVDSHKTAGFPGNSGVQTWHEDRQYGLSGHLQLRGVPDDRRDQVFLRFWAIEYDGSDRDSRLSPEQEVVPVSFRTSSAPARATTVTVGRETGACRLTLSALPTWSPAR